MRLKIRHKLFLAILLANSLLLAGIYLSSVWIFETSFRDYLDQSEAQRLQPLVEELAEVYRLENNWLWVRDRRGLWRQLTREYAQPGRFPGSLERRSGRPEHDGPVGDGAKNGWGKIDGRIMKKSFDHPPPDGPPPRGEPPAGGPPLTGIHPGLLLKSAEGGLVIGPPNLAEMAYWIPIVIDTQQVGSLGFYRPTNIDDEVDRLFLDRIESYWLWLLIVMLVMTALIAVFAARKIVRPVEHLKSAFAQLTGGNLEILLESKGNDEIAELQRDFNRLTLTMKSNLSSRQRWIADISHELRTPVAVLQAEIEAILDGYRESDKQSIDSLHHEVLRLTRLIDDLHELSMSDQGAMNYQAETIDLVPLLEAIVDRQQRQFEDKALRLRLKTAVKTALVRADPKRLEQLFVNLARNSMTYTEDAGRAEVEICDKQEGIVICWSDSGPGVSDDEINLLFDRLYRAETSRNRSKGGSGLGLAICQSIVEASEGKVQAEHSKLGGVTIKITLPKAD